MDTEKTTEKNQPKNASGMHFSLLLVMSVLHFLVMYVLMFSTVVSFEHIYMSNQKLYMAGIMTAQMIIIEVLLMGKMYTNKNALYALLGGSVALFVLLFVFIRQQTVINNKQFLQAMIPHHSGAILMCKQADITDPDILDLCDDIVETQKREIDSMERELSEITSSE